LSRRARLAVLAALAAAVAGAWLGDAGAGTAEDGKGIYQAQCASCHTIGGGDLVGPDLAGVTARRDRAWLERFIQVPDQVLAEGDPVAAELLQKYNGVPMPSLGLTDDQVASLIAYLEAEGGAAPPAEAAPAATVPASQEAAAEPAPAALAPGDADTGKSLFTGAERFEDGGPPCMSCHSIAGIGALGGGALGPDLTGAYAKYGDAQGLSSVLATLPFPTMVPVFDGRPLTAQEQADLVAFLAEAAEADRPGWAIGKLLLLSFGSAAALTAVALVAWRSRLVAVRRSLVKRSRPRRK
jgi:mono/diheme cytochrome c family protein